ncbi:MAG TPA: helix-turn-helix domain-containing protein, partial [Nocardioides sp.]|nr:helix-turn-helix domain-containing protein [Nocardioides sp.]
MTDLLSTGAHADPGALDPEDGADTAERPVVEPDGQPSDHPHWGAIPDELEDDEVIVRRNGRISVVLAGVSALLAAAYFARAVTQLGVLDWALCIGLTAITWAWVFSFLDSRMPLLVADSHGVRIRLGRTWRGMAWSDLEEVEYTPRRGPFRDGRLVLFPRDLEHELALLGPAGRRHAKASDRMHGAPFALPLGLTTRVLGAHGDLAGALESLADGRSQVVEVLPGASENEPTGLEDYYAGAAPDDEANDEQAEAATVVPPAAAALVASPTPSPLRDVRPAVRSEVEHEREWDTQTQSIDLPAIAPAATTFVIDDLAAREAVEPVIGPELRAARQRLRLSVDQLAERTRIRPHVIEAIEIDDFAPCGGDFYARGHLRTLARVLGVDVTPLLATYDERYADAPIDPRRVFEAELATGRNGPIRGVKGGPNWSVIVAAVMTVVLAWSVARLVMDHPSAVSPSSPTLADGSACTTRSRSAGSPTRFS